MPLLNDADKVYVGGTAADAVYVGSTQVWSAVLKIGDPFMGGYYAGVIDTTQGNIIAADASQTGLRYMLIVAPKSLETTAVWSSLSVDVAAAKTRWNGLAATAAMASSSYPAANYCAGLAYPSDDGSAWYLPAMDELELLYRNFRPGSASNPTGTLNVSSSFFPPGLMSHGANPSSDPVGAAYTSSDPAQTTVAAFVSGGAQALDSTDNYQYWCSTQYSSTAAWQLRFGYEAAPGSSNKMYSTYSVRPVRRLVL